MSTPTGHSEQPAKKNSEGLPPSFNSAPSSRAIGLVAIAVLVGVLLLVIVDSDNTSNKKSDASQAGVTTTTLATDANSEPSSAESTSTTTPIAGIKKPAEVSVLVLNGSSGAGIATSVSSSVGELGYKMLTPGNDSSTAKGTIIYYKAGFEKDAKQIATNILPGILTDLDISQDVKTEQFPGSAPTEWDQDNLVGANVVVVVGNA